VGAVSVVCMAAKITRIEFDREDGETVSIETSDSVVIDVCPRSLWRSFPGDGGATVVDAGRWVVIVSRRPERIYPTSPINAEFNGLLSPQKYVL